MIADEDLGKRVFIYRNLRQDCWSIKALSGPHRGTVIAHAREWILSDCIFKVSQAGRARVLREARKNVHAGVIGTLDYMRCTNSTRVGRRIAVGGNLQRASKVSYNPYIYSTFIDLNTEKPVYKAFCAAALVGSWVIFAMQKTLEFV